MEKIAKAEVQGGSILHFGSQEKIKSVHYQVHRLVVVDSDDKVEGVISLSDILAFLALRPLDDDPRCTNTEVDSADEKSQKSSNGASEIDLDKNNNDDHV